MPKSRRQRVVPLTQTGKKGRALKEELVNNIRDCLDKYAYLYVFKMDNPRSSAMKEIRIEYRESRFFLGKNKVMQIALGRTADEEAKGNTFRVTQALKGTCGLFFSDEEPDNVIAFLESHRPADYAKPGFKATHTFTLPAGKLTEFLVSSEPLLRSLGLPVKVNKGTLELPEPYTVCETGQTLTPEQARLLKLFKEPMSVFAMHVTGFWHDGQYTRILKDGSQVVVGEGDVMQDEDDDEVEEAEEDEDMEDGDD